MRELCRGINSLTVDLMELMYHSADARRDSIIGVIETYGRTFPQCLIVEMNLDAAQLANEMNERIERYVRLHMEYLEDACNEIMDMRTALKLPESREGKANPGTLAYDQPPYAPANQRAYMLFLEEGEVK